MVISVLIFSIAHEKRLNLYIFSTLDLIFGNYKILYLLEQKLKQNKNRLLLMDVLFIKSYKPELNNGLKASSTINLIFPKNSHFRTHTSFEMMEINRYTGSHS